MTSYIPCDVPALAFRVVLIALVWGAASCGSPDHEAGTPDLETTTAADGGNSAPGEPDPDCAGSACPPPTSGTTPADGGLAPPGTPPDASVPPPAADAATPTEAFGGGASDGGAEPESDGGEAPPPDDAPPPEIWARVEAPIPESSLILAVPALQDVSTWVGEGCGKGQPREPRLMGDFAVGNGRVFALTGYTCPLNTLHSMIGPTYQKDTGYFSDTSFTVESQGEALKFSSGHVYRVRGTPVVITREASSAVWVTTVTFAAYGPDAQNGLENTILRHISIRNNGAEPLTQLRVGVAPGSSQRDALRREALIVEPPTAANDIAANLPDIPPGGEATVRYAHIMVREGETMAAAIASLNAADWSALAASTIAAWRARTGAGLRLTGGDPMVADFIDGMAATILVQQAHTGAVCPMSLYTSTWTRDTAGPLRFLALMGLHGPAREMFDYYLGATVMRGDLGNALRADLDLADVPAQPDWRAKPPMTGRTAAEGPSYVPIMAQWLFDATGDPRDFDTYYDLFHRAVTAQAYSAAWLLPFSGDETYRAALGAALGLPLEYDFPGCCDSANSSFLAATAIRILRDWALIQNRTADAGQFNDLSVRVTAALEATFWHPDGYYAPFIRRDGSLALPPPFEDVSTQPLWSGYLSPADERALQNLDTVVARLGQAEPGFLQSPLSPTYKGVLLPELEKGMYTGMVPGYYLYNLAAQDHPLAEAAFNAYLEAASPSGNFAEYQIADDHSALQIVYETQGDQGDYTARFRPWEGGINAGALVYYLTGFEPHAGRAHAGLAPRLPNRWRQAKWSNFRVGTTAFDLDIQWHASARRLELAITHKDGPAVTLAVAIIAPDGGELQSLALAPPLPEGSGQPAVRRLPGRGARTLVPEFALAPGAKQTIIAGP